MENYIDNPKVSVYINTRNRCKIISRALDSLLNQTYTNFEVLILDAGSTDLTESVVDYYVKLDKRFKYFKYDDRKLATCLNYIISKAKGEYITQLDDDDEYFPQKIEKQLKLFESSKNDVAVIYCWEEFWDDKLGKKIFDNKPTVKGDAYLKLLYSSCVGGGTTMMMRKSAFDMVRGFDESIEFGADYQLNINLSKYFKHDFVPEVLVKTHINHEYNRLSNSKSRDKKYYQNSIEMIEKILSDNVDVFSKNNHLMIPHYISIVNQALRAKNYKLFFLYFKRGINLKVSFQERIIFILNGIKHIIKKY